MELSAIPLGAYRVRVWQAEESRYSCPGSGWGVFLSRRKGGCGTVSEMRVEGKWDWQWENPPANAGDVRDVGSIPGLGRSPGEGNANPFQYSCLRNPVDRGAWQETVHGITMDMSLSKLWEIMKNREAWHAAAYGVAKSRTWLSNWTTTTRKSIRNNLRPVMSQLVKNLPAMWETWVRSLGWEDCPGEGKGYPLQYSGLENSMDCICIVIII